MRSSPLRNALGVCVLIIIAGIVTIVLGERIVARTLNVYDQVPALVSGGLGGLALVITGCVLALVQVGRACAEWERADEASVLDQVETLIDAEHGISESAGAEVDAMLDTQVLTLDTQALL